MATAPLYDTFIGHDRVIRETAKAMLVIRARSALGKALGIDAPQTWLPKSAVRWQQAPGSTIKTIHAPMWLCQDKGL